MSEPIPEAIPTSADRRSHRPVKKARTNTPTSQQSSQVEALFANPDREIQLPTLQSQRTLAPPPEIVANVQGSSAGAGSGEFHVYKASRRREYERLRLMEEEVETEEKEKQWKEKQEDRKKVDEEKLSKNQAKRAKAKARSEKKKNGGAGEMEVDGEKAKDGVGVGKKKLGPARVAVQNGGTTENDDTRAMSNGHQNRHTLDEGSGITFHDD